MECRVARLGGDEGGALPRVEASPVNLVLHRQLRGHGGWGGECVVECRVWGVGCRVLGVGCGV